MTSQNNSIKDSWVKVITVNSLEYNIDKSMIIAATNRGYQVYDSTHYTSLSRIDDTQDKIGPISKASLLHKSQLVCFLGSNDNKKYHPNKLVIWNDYSNDKEGFIVLYDTILSYSLLTYAVCIFVPFRLLLFNLVNLEFVLKLEDFPNEARLINFSNTNPIIIANCSNLNKKTIKLTSFLVKDKRLFCKREMKLKTDFNNIHNIAFSESSNLLIVASDNSRLHLYNTDTYRLKYCLHLNQPELKLSNYCFDTKEKYLLFIVNKSEVKVYKMYGKKNSFSYKCLCQEQDKQLTQKKKGNLFGSFFNKMFTDAPNEFASYKFKPGGMCRLFMNPQSKTVMTLVYQNGYAVQLQLNRRSKNSFKMLKEIAWLQ